MSCKSKCVVQLWKNITGHNLRHILLTRLGSDLQRVCVGGEAQATEVEASSLTGLNNTKHMDHCLFDI